MTTFNDTADLKRQPVSIKGFPQPIQRQMEQRMPARSKRQFRFMQAAAHGAAKAPGLSQSEAKEFVSGQSPKGLPEKAPRRQVKYPSPKKR